MFTIIVLAQLAQPGRKLQTPKQIKHCQGYLVTCGARFRIGREGAINTRRRRGAPPGNFENLSFKICRKYIEICKYSQSGGTHSGLIFTLDERLVNVKEHDSAAEESHQNT